MLVLVTGTFDIPHAGHASFLRQAAALGKLKVGVLSDDFVTQCKGRSPLYGAEERADLVTQMSGAPAYIINSQRRFFREEGILDSTIIAVGSDWAYKDYYDQIGVSQEELDDLGYGLLYIPYTSGISTSEIMERVRGV